MPKAPPLTVGTVRLTQGSTSKPVRVPDPSRARTGFFLARAYPLSVAPVALVTAATIFAATASISLSVSVAWVGCSVTASARDFWPSGTPLPW